MLYLVLIVNKMFNEMSWNPSLGRCRPRKEDKWLTFTQKLKTKTHPEKQVSLIPYLLKTFSASNEEHIHTCETICGGIKSFQ